MRLVTWNLRHGGGAARMPELALALAGLDPDVVVLTEAHQATAGQIVAAMGRGVAHWVLSPGLYAENRVLVASRWPLTPCAVVPPPASRTLCVARTGPGLTVIGIYLPPGASDRIRQETASQLVMHARDAREVDGVILGDLNTSRDPTPGSGRVRTDHVLGKLHSLGFADAFGLAGGGEDAPTWRGPRSAARRLDYALVSAPLVPRVSSLRHVATDLSDHSAVVLDLLDP